MSKVVLITGAASGLGWALSRYYAARGDQVVLVDMDESALLSRCRELSHVDARYFSCDITDSARLVALVDFCRTEFGRLDVVINNAGITHRSPAPVTQPDVLRRVMAVDWQAPMELALLALPLLRESRGALINIGSMAGWMPVPGRAGYCAAKSALAQFFEVLRLETEHDGIHVLMAYPSFLDTPIEHNALGADGNRAAHARSTAGNVRSADWMAQRIVTAADKRKRWLFGDGLSLFASVLWRLWPSLYLRLIRRRFASELAH